MSVYDFNHHHQEQAPNNSHPSHGASNGIQTRYNHNQVDNDYLNRGFSSTHNLDMSVQVTRPTSKTALLVRQRRAMLEQLSCYLCKGYLIDATTVDECMDPFCKSCIVIYLRNHNNCPKCGTLIHKTNPLSSIRSDKVLQDIVYKLVPGLYDDEMKRRREFYRGVYAISSDEDDEDGSSSSFNGRLSGEQYGVVSHPKSFYKPTDHIDLSIEPQTRGDNTSIYYDNKTQSIVTCFTGNSQQQQHLPQGSQGFSAVDSQQFKTYLRCPAKLTALQLKKFIATKFNICKDDTIHLLYLNESLRDDYSLIDIAYIYDWRGIEHMRLFYIIARDLGKLNYNTSNNNQQIETGQLNSRAKTRQSVGTSTQTVKRVCIDPHPKFYEWQNNNKVVNNSDSNNNNGNINGGRHMRPRNECSTGSNKVVTTSQSSQSPVIRSNATNRQTLAVSIGLPKANGVSGREITALRVQATRTPLTGSAVTSAVDELSRVNQDRESKEIRCSPRKITSNEISPGSIPKININLNSLNQAQAKNLNTYSKVTIGLESGQQEGAVKQSTTSSVNKNHNVPSNIRQLVPWKGYPAMTCVAGPSQSSIVTLASFTEARSNHVVAMSTSTATTMSNSYKNLISPGHETKSAEVKSSFNQSTSKPPQPGPQLACFRTEQGITIIRRLNHHEEATVAAAATSRNSPAITTTKASSTVLSLPAPPTSQTSSSNVSHVRTSNSPNYQSNVSNSYYSAGTSAGGSQTNISSTGQDGISPRHLVKVKPVYKTFVDPTKLKSPNFKKLGYTARH